MTDDAATKFLHGGVIMALADSAGGACAFSNLPEGAIGTSTIESKTNFFGAVESGKPRSCSARADSVESKEAQGHMTRAACVAIGRWLQESRPCGSA